MKALFNTLRAAAVLTTTLWSAAALAQAPAPQTDNKFDAGTIARGKYLATASDCMACHTAHHGKPMAGGLVMSSPVGDIVSTNITPSTEHGIGKYTEQQFSDAVRRGVRADGQMLYPAMPYTSYAKITDEDIHAMYAYFMADVPVVDKATAVTSLPFPMNIRQSMKVWNALFLDDQPLKAAPAQSAQWLRGQYLAEGAAHCTTCHTPRGVLMQEDKSRHLSGAQVGPWYAPNITSHPTAGIGSWTEDELVQYLKTGRVEGKAQAAGSMAEAISLSFSHLQQDDLKAIAVYIKSLPAVVGDADRSAGPSRFDQGQPGNALDKIRGTSYGENVKGANLGAQIFSANCASCHGFNGQGTKDGYYPSLFHNSATVNTSNLLATILLGVDRKTADGHVFMPPFGDQVNAVNHLTDNDVAALANYMLVQFGPGAGKDTPTIKPQDVAEIRQGGPQSHLLTLARAGAVLGVLVAALVIVFIVRRRKRAATVTAI
jgi:mono/diheme cytochrome c family protein